MIGVVIVPTGIGAELGGHAGDANPMLKLIGACCETVITHPNVVNASDINEMPENCLYVEGSILDRFLRGEITLKPVRKPNRILMVVNAPACEQSINAAAAAAATIGCDIEVLELDTPLKMIATMESGNATGEVTGELELYSQVKDRQFDALAVHTKIEVERDVALNYYRKGGVNPWGGVEAKASKLIANLINKPVAHAPLESVEAADEELFTIHDEVLDPRIAPEALSMCYLHCILKGLHRAPEIGNPTAWQAHRLNLYDVDFMVAPKNCYGPAHAACVEAGIPIICVKENGTVNSLGHPEGIQVDNYLEAAGVVMAMKAGVTPASVRRPFKWGGVIGKGE